MPFTTKVKRLIKRLLLSKIMDQNACSEYFLKSYAGLKTLIKQSIFNFGSSLQLCGQFVVDINDWCHNKCF